MSSLPPVKPVPQVCWLDTQSLRTSLAPLRSSAPPPAQLAPVLGEMPLRVARRDDGSFEVLDGLKRLAQWMCAGHAQVPVIVEQACSTVEQKVLLLRANAPPRSLTAMDEARVVDSLIQEEGQTEAAVRRATAHRAGWVSRRLVLARQLAPSLCDKVDHRELGPSLAYALCALPAPQQESVWRSAERGGLTTRETFALLSAFRVASEAERASLLAQPVRAVRPDRSQAPAFSPLCARLEERLRRTHQALLDLASFSIPDEGLSPAERRRIEAQHRAVLELLATTAARAAETSPATTSNPQPQEQDDERRRHEDGPLCPEPSPGRTDHRGDDAEATPAHAERGGAPEHHRAVPQVRRPPAPNCTGYAPRSQDSP